MYIHTHTQTELPRHTHTTNEPIVIERDTHTHTYSLFVNVVCYVIIIIITIQTHTSSHLIFFYEKHSSSAREIDKGNPAKTLVPRACALIPVSSKLFFTKLIASATNIIF